MSGIAVSSLAGSQFEPVTGPPFPLFSIFFPCSSFRQEIFWVRVFDYGMATPSLTWCRSFFRRYSLQVPSKHCRAFHLQSLPLSRECLSPHRSLVHFRGGGPPLTSYLPKLYISICSAYPWGFTSGSPQPVPDHVPLLLCPSPSSLPQFPPPSTFCFLLVPKWDWNILTWVLWFVTLFEFCGLYPVYPVLFWLISTYWWVHALLDLRYFTQDYIFFSFSVFFLIFPSLFY